MASSFFILVSFAKSFSTFSLKATSLFATMVFKTVMGLAQLAFDPTARNSNLFPVKANGEVLLRSVLSNKISGIFPTTLSLRSVFSSGDNFPLETCSRSVSTFVNCFPIKTEIIVGGASFAPRR